MRMLVENNIFDRGRALGYSGAYVLYRVTSETGGRFLLKQADLQSASREEVELCKAELAMLQRFARCRGIVQLVAQESTLQSMLVVTELSDCTLADIASGGNLQVSQAKHYARQLFEILRLIHGQAITHGSLEPASFQCFGNTLKLVEFGQRGSGGGGGNSGSSVAYMAPEGPGQAGDVWSCGVILYEMVYGRLPQGPLDESQFDPNGKTFHVDWDVREVLDKCVTPAPRRATAEVVLELMALSRKSATLVDIKRMMRECIQSAHQRPPEQARALTVKLFNKLG